MQTRLFQIFFVLVLAGIVGCGQEIKPKADVVGSIDGYVFVTGPVSGAVVKLYAYDPVTGDRVGYPDHPIATSVPTSSDGHFHFDFGPTYGPMWLEARSPEAMY